MADILKVTTPLVDKLPQQTQRPAAADPSMPFNLSDVSRVTQTVDTSEILQQNTGMLPGQPNAPRILAELLSDPSVTASMIGSISLLQEVINLMPANNNALTMEIQQLFAQLLVRPEDIVAELLSQQESTTLFRGDLFDQLRGLLAQNAGKQEVATSVGVLLKALNATIVQPDVLESVANNLTFLSQQVYSSALLSNNLLDLAAALRQPGAAQNFPELKNQVLALLGQVENSVLFTPALQKMLPLVVYNLSRYNDNPDFIPAALNLLLYNMDGTNAQKLELVNNLEAFLNKVVLGKPAGAGEAVATQAEGKALPGAAVETPPTAQAQAQQPAGSAVELATQRLIQRLQEHFAQSKAGELFAQVQLDGPREARDVDPESRVIDTLAKIIAKQAASEEVHVLTGDKVDKIIQSLLSSPSNFTPLLHFIVPVQSEDMRAFAEIWVDPNAEGEENGRRKGQDGDTTHMLMVFDVEGIGRFESELYVQNKRIAMNLLCPPAYVDAFRELGPAIRQAVQATGYSFESISIDRMERTHSLMDVFTDLPHRRTGIDVKI